MFKTLSSTDSAVVFLLLTQGRYLGNNLSRNSKLVLLSGTKSLNRTKQRVQRAVVSGETPVVVRLFVVDPDFLVDPNWPDLKKSRKPAM